MPPNILFIMTDNQPAELLGCYGNEEIHTPHLDRLAAQGIRFDNATCVNGMCSPCRASVLTGLMPSQHGIHTWLDDRLMDSWPPEWNGIAEFAALPELLRQNGYRTALIGKYHVGAPFAPQNGFEHWVTFPYGHTRSFWGNEIIENGRTHTYPGHSVDCFTEKAVEYIQHYDADAPFFLFLTYNAPYGHWPAIQGPGIGGLAAGGADGGDAGHFHGRSRFFSRAQWLLGARAGYLALQHARPGIQRTFADVPTGAYCPATNVQIDGEPD
ncbi:MAG: sulfatase-like hydrolase/transferase [Chloroflexi bacterium]|nr:sulfatase-like hydrolase/transferase [Chloroflexota bacterium]